MTCILKRETAFRGMRHRVQENPPEAAGLRAELQSSVNMSGILDDSLLLKFGEDLLHAVQPVGAPRLDVQSHELFRREILVPIFQELVEVDDPLGARTPAHRLGGRRWTQLI